jgi:hypothetical protein
MKETTGQNTDKGGRRFLCEPAGHCHGHDRDERRREREPRHAGAVRGPPLVESNYYDADALFC